MIKASGFPVRLFKHYVALAIAVVVFADLSRYLSVEGLPISLVWPAGGLIFGAALVLGLPVILVSGLALAGWLFFLQGDGLATSLFLPLAQVAGILTGLSLVLLSERQRAALQQTDRQKRILYIRAGAISATVTAVIGSFGLVAGGSAHQTFAFHDIFLVYWLLEAMGLMLFAPLSYLVLRAPNEFLRGLRADFDSSRLWAWYCAILTLTLLVYLVSGVAEGTYAVALGFMFFPALCWFVLMARGASVTLVLPIFAVLFVVFSLNGLGGLPQMLTVSEIVRSLLVLAGLTVLIEVIAVMSFTQRQMVETFRAQANTDFLSGLNNDRAFSKLIRLELDRITRQPPRVQGGTAWLVYMQFLDFAQIEDLMGPKELRSLEMMLVARLMGTIGADASPARLGKGIFGFILNDDSVDSLDGELKSLYEVFDDQIFGADDSQSRVRVSIGAVRLDGRLGDASQYLSAATQAALTARDHLPRIHRVDDVESLMVERRNQTHRLELLKDALSNDRLILYAQPIYAIGREDERVNFEILVRMEDSEGNLLSPDFFLPIAEAYGVMRQIDQWVITRTLETLAANPEWLEATGKCSINLAGVTLSSDEVIHFLEEAFQRTGVPPHKIGFEVTETQQIQRRESAEHIIRRLRTMGCSVSLDDFGTGLATFDYLRTFEFDIVKIDGVFVKSIEHNERDRCMVKAICEVAANLGLTTVAEYVENDGVLAELAKLGVDYGQGYGLGRPMPFEELFIQRRMEQSRKTGVAGPR